MATKIMTASQDTSSDDEQYPHFLDVVRKRFQALTEPNEPLFTTSATGLWTTFLETIPADRRQHYDCRSCARFVDRFGGLVTIGPEGQATPVMWDPATAPPFFREGVRALHQAVSKASVTGIFLSEEKTWGLPQNADPGGPAMDAQPATETTPARVARVAREPRIWHHLAVKPHGGLVVRPTGSSLSASQIIAARLVDHATLDTSLGEYPIELVQAAHTLLTSGGLYRAEKALPVATWFLELHTRLKAADPGARRANLKWVAAATAPAGFTHVRNLSIATLFDDIAAKMSVEKIKERWAVTMDPARYQRAQVAPSAGNIREAEKIIAESGVAASLERRYALLADLCQFIWRAPGTKVPIAPAPGGVFSHLVPKAPKPAAPAIDLAIPPQVMTWVKFARDVLPSAVSVEALVPPSPERLMALVTAANPEAPPILAWDSSEARNPISWYYARGGIDAEVRRRVEAAGGQYKDVDIRASLIWGNHNDLDLHVIPPSGEEVYFRHMQSRCGGWLDIDMNASGETDKPVENVRWGKGMARPGRYRVFVRNFRFWERDVGSTPFRVELEIAGEFFTVDGVSPARFSGEQSDVLVADFVYTPGTKVTAIGGATRPSGSPTWNLTPGSWAPVSGVVESPNLWGDRPQAHHGRHIFVLLEGCRDTEGTHARGFHTEALLGALRPIRSTLEAFVTAATIAGAEEASACGIGMKEGGAWDLTLRVKTAGGALTYKIDRWE